MEVESSGQAPARENGAVCVRACECVLRGVPRAGSQLRGELPAAGAGSALAPWEPRQWPENMRAKGQHSQLSCSFTSPPLTSTSLILNSWEMNPMNSL